MRQGATVLRNVSSKFESAFTDFSLVYLFTLQLTIHITDENDNPPIFTQEIYTSTIPENVPTRFLFTQVITTDADIGINAEHTFSITGTRSLSVCLTFLEFLNRFSPGFDFVTEPF